MQLAARAGSVRAGYGTCRNQRMTSSCARRATPARMFLDFRQFSTPFPGLIDTVHIRPQLTDLKIALTPSSNELAQTASAPSERSMVINLHRMLALALLCVGLFVASGPAFACCAQGSPTQECCPTRAHEAGYKSDQISAPSASQSCCVVAAQTALGTAIDVTQSTPDHQAHAPFSLVYLATLSTTDSPIRVGVSSTNPTFSTLSPVYLRTGRLRL